MTERITAVRSVTLFLLTVSYLAQAVDLAVNDVNVFR